MCNLKTVILIVCVIAIENKAETKQHNSYFNRYTGEKLEDEKIEEYKKLGTLSACAILVKPCAQHEGSRVDGTCNNHNNPTKGSAFGPYLYLLKPEYSEDNGPRTAKDGSPLPSARVVRTALGSTGQVVDKTTFNMAAVHYAGFAAVDVSATRGSFDFLRKRNCCGMGNIDPKCSPISVPENDQLYRLAHIKCLNYSRPSTAQDFGCIPSSSPLEPQNEQTPLLDLSSVYGSDESSLAKLREGKDGLLKMEWRDNRYVPLGNASKNNCFQNRPNETICYQFGLSSTGNFDLRIAQFSTFFMREHNRIAKFLKELNPCWKDDRLFKVARQINIGSFQNILMYELSPIIMGRKNMINYGLISERVEHVRQGDENSEPLAYREFVIGMRFFHTMVDGRIKMYDEDYKFSGSFSLSDTVFRPALLEENSNYEEINRGSFFQNAAKVDDVLDPEIGDTFYGELQQASDLGAIDIQRGRDMGLKGYNAYRELCGMKTAKKFEDFEDTMGFEKIEALKNVYADVDDVDLLAGIKSERMYDNTFVGPTLFCIMAKQLHLWRYADRFWFERGDNPHSFSFAQLKEIRKTNMARFACNNVEGIKYLQPQAFLNVGPGNAPIPCSRIYGADLTKWKDDTCQPQRQEPQQQSSTFNPYLNY